MDAESFSTFLPQELINRLLEYPEGTVLEMGGVSVAHLEAAAITIKKALSVNTTGHDKYSRVLVKVDMARKLLILGYGVTPNLKTLNVILPDQARGDDRVDL